MKSYAMKSFTLRIEKNPEKGVKERLLRAVKTGVPHVRPDEMVCSSANAMSAAFSKAKLEVFAAIVEHKPSSVRELAKIVKKDESNVSRELKALELIGVIKLEKSKDDGRPVQPVALYDRIIFEFSPARKARGN